jgi:predicted transcriptional regulator
MQVYKSKLEKYLVQNNISIKAFSQKIGCSYSHIYKLKKRWRGASPSINMIKKIMKATEGKVKSEDWI